MKKQVSSREFFHNFSRLHAGLKPGEALVITRHGKPLGQFIKEPAKKLFKIPDLKELGFEPKARMASREAAYKAIMGGMENEGLS